MSYFICVIQQELVFRPVVWQQQLLQLAGVRLRIVLLEADLQPTSFRPRHPDAVEVLVHDVLELRHVVHSEDISKAVVVLRKVGLFQKLEKAGSPSPFAHHFKGRRINFSFVLKKDVRFCSLHFVKILNFFLSYFHETFLRKFIGTHKKREFSFDLFFFLDNFFELLLLKNSSRRKKCKKKRKTEAAIKKLRERLIVKILLSLQCSAKNEFYFLLLQLFETKEFKLFPPSSLFLIGYSEETFN